MPRVFIYPVATLSSFWVIYQVRMKVSKVTKNILCGTVDALSDMNRGSRA